MAFSLFRARLWPLLLLVFSASVSAETLQPQADPKAVVVSGQARFTVLSPQLVRMEWSPDSAFEDGASLVFLRRKQPVPPFKVERSNGELLLTTAALSLRFKEGSGRFGPETLSITFKRGAQTLTWRPGMADTGNLAGTTRTLDRVDGPVELEAGLLSREGWVVVDDSARPLLEGTEQPWVTPRPAGERLDWYFFGHGRDYKQALFDFTRVAGRIPMPPRYAFGYWWSRYWAYTDAELRSLVAEFEAHDVPLDVLVVDMDWHDTFESRWWRPKKDQAGEPLGWTGHTWNKTYFPDPQAFLDWTRTQGLKVTLNLHPASGIQPHEAQYPAVARAMGMDPASQKYVPFDIVERKFAQAYMREVIHPLEAQGVDFWWLDWQQWSTTKIPGVSPTFWLNHVFFTDMESQNKSRPMLFHRWGGLGNHRYQIGFSGDSYSTWASLAFQPRFTSTASNVAYGYWSHDIGGHLAPNMVGDHWKDTAFKATPLDPELYTRWVQFGALSPILRTHSTKDPILERRLWAYPDAYARAMREAVHLRYALLPYLYTAARQAYDTGVSLLRPMYYEWPEADEAYRFMDQYQLGDDLIVAPITAPADRVSGLSRKELWLPAGEWVGWFSGERIRGPAVVTRTYALNESPIFVRAGAIVPMQSKAQRAQAVPGNGLVLTVFPGASGATRVYEDQGDSLGYQRGEFSMTAVRTSQPGPTSLRVEIGAAEGRYPGMPAARANTLKVTGVFPPKSVMAAGRSVPYRPDGAAPGWRYEGDSLTVVVALAKTPVSRKLDVQLEFAEPAGSELLAHFAGRQAQLQRAVKTLSGLWPHDAAPESVVRLSQTGHRLTLNPTSAKAELQRFAQEYPAVQNAVRGLRGAPQTVAAAVAQLE